MSTILYLPISSSSLPHFWGSGLIMPSMFYTQSLEKIQPFTNSLLLTKELYRINSNCCLEIIFADNEIGELTQIEPGAYIYNSCLPVTRINKILFQSLEQKKTTIWNIEQGTAFIPDRLVEVKEAPKVNHRLFAPQSPSSHNNGLTEKVLRFNVILGGLALMRLAYDGCYKGSENYFETLGHFNAQIKNRISWYKHNKKIEADERYIDLFTSKDSIWREWRDYIYREIGVEDIERIAKRNGLKLDRSLSGFKLDNIDVDSIFYDVLLLATYGENKPKSLQDLIHFIFDKNLSISKIEEIGLLFGLNTGYSKLRNQYKVKKKEIDIKFRFDSQLDYFIVESVFNFIFNGQSFITDFPYLERVLPKNQTAYSHVPDGKFLMIDVIGTTKENIALEKSESGAEFLTKKTQKSSNITLDSLKEIFLKTIAQEIFSWGIPYDTDKVRLLKAEQFTRTRFGPPLNDLISSSIKHIEEKAVSTINTNLPDSSKNKNGDTRPSVLSFSFWEKYENINWNDLKKAAHEKNITVPKSKKGTLKEFAALINQIENTQTII